MATTGTRESMTKAALVSEKDSDGATSLGRILVVAALVIIAALTLTRGSSYTRPEVEWCIACGERGTTDAILNVLLFVPLGAGLALSAGRRLAFWRIAVISFAISTCIEAAQLLVIYGRTCSVGDVVTNTTGGVLGALVATHWRTLVTPRRRAAFHLGVVGAILWLGVLIVTSLALQPYPSDAELHVQLQPDIPSESYQYQGRVDSASIDGVSLALGLMPESTRSRVNLRSGTLSASVEVGPPAPHMPSIIVRVLDERYDTQLQLSRVDDALVFEQRFRSIAFRLGMLQARAERVFSTTESGSGCGLPNTRLHIAGNAAGGRMGVVARGSHCQREFSVPLRATLGWIFLLPFRYALGTEASILTALWLAGLVFVWSYWLGAAVALPRDNLRALGIAGTTIVLGLGVTPRAFSLSPCAWHEWLVAALALLAGVAVGQRVGRNIAA